MTEPRRICVVTGSRAEYGLLQPLLREIARDPQLQLLLLVTGTHLAPEFGSTVREIEQDGFAIDDRIEILLSSDTPVGVTKSLGLAVMGFGEAYARHRPDIVVALGDRFELLGAVAAALVSLVPVAHIHGGEMTLGAFDDSLRHAISKMSHLHFASTETYRRRLLQMGEPPDRVFTVGALGLDNLRTLRPLPRPALEERLGLMLKGRNLLITFHPPTLHPGQAAGHFQALLEAVDSLEDVQLIFTRANADPEGRRINELIDAFVARRPDRAAAFPSLGHLLYLSTMRHVDVVLGNSSSGIIEAPGLKVPTVNVGDRQEGRVRAPSVIDCEPGVASIRAALDRALGPAFRRSLEHMEHPYGDGHAAERIKEVLASCPLRDLVHKRFHDLDWRAPADGEGPRMATRDRAAECHP